MRGGLYGSPNFRSLEAYVYPRIPSSTLVLLTCLLPTFGRVAQSGTSAISVGP